eukprot:CAMPEP_0119025050 /NCGR_PEP_ID=MMETSP1176-20130426/33049_1 /TAXON_ID=265551 /ORGANISM="Synedropsis recta cf, Strain CCMP1620" /LENGTH=233 /DNA_ID=CAMNT_0006980497 /DNA_START=94 /DNA_END=792 /DNA_ORIENTATION=+
MSEQVKVKSKFWSILQNGLTNLMSDAQETWDGPDGEDYALEKALLARSYRPFMWGMGSTCLCFVTFRVTGSAWFRQIRQSLRPNQSRTIPRPPPEAKEAKKHWKSYSEKMMDKRTAAMTDVMSLPTDALLSILLGISITGITLSPSVRKQEFQVAPLLRGKSLLSKHLCKDMTHLYHEADPTIWEKPDDTLEALRNFAINCQKRDQVEQTIRLEQNIVDTQSVAIPPPHVEYW